MKIKYVNSKLRNINIKLNIFNFSIRKFKKGARVLELPPEIRRPGFKNGA